MNNETAVEVAATERAAAAAAATMAAFRARMHATAVAESNRYPTLEMDGFDADASYDPNADYGDY